MNLISAADLIWRKRLLRNCSSLAKRLVFTASCVQCILLCYTRSP